MWILCSARRWPSVARNADIKLLDILKIMCEVVGYQQAEKKFNSQTM